MPIYEYEHTGTPCDRGVRFDQRQSVNDETLKKCPDCGGAVRRIISLVGINTPKSNSELRDLGFSKLVKRDDGIYENVTARKGESKYMERDKPHTMPDMKKIISD